MKSWDVVIIGGGIIGLSLSLSLRKEGASVLIVEKTEPGREASHAAAGMLAHCEQPDALRELARASARLYPEFVREIEEESGSKVDYRRDGTLLLRSGPEDEPSCEEAVHLGASALAEMEPALASNFDSGIFLPEGSVDPRALISAALKAARRRGVDISSGDAAQQINLLSFPSPSAVGVITAKTRFPARAVVNCAGAWSGQIGNRTPLPPTRPVKGHMLDLIPADRVVRRGRDSSTPLLFRHVIRTPEVYLVPRTDGRIVVGSTVEEAGFDKRIDPDTIQTLFQSAANVLPELGQAKIHETWTGLRPGTPDGLPILGATSVPNYFIATGHYRDGILLAPITGKLISQIIRRAQPDLDITPFSPLRFE